MRTAAVALFVLLALLPAAPGAANPPAPSAPRDTASSLAEGNRRFAKGDLEGALAAYLAGTAGEARSGPDPLLAYNLGSTAQHLGRLPEAVLWYRRAAAGLPADRWLRDNLALARAELQRTGVPAPESRPFWAAARESRRPLLFAGIVCGWIALPLAFLPSRRWRRRLVATAGALAVASFAAGLALPHLTPTPAVLLAPCAEALPAGSEVWGRPLSGGRFHIVDGPVCSAAAVGLVGP